MRATLENLAVLAVAMVQVADLEENAEEAVVYTTTMAQGLKQASENLIARGLSVPNDEMDAVWVTNMAMEIGTLLLNTGFPPSVNVGEEMLKECLGAMENSSLFNSLLRFAKAINLPPL